MAKLFSYQLLFDATIHLCLISLLSLALHHSADCLLPSTTTTSAIVILVVHSQSISFDSIPFHSIRYLPRTTKWYTTIKQFKFISVCDQFYAQVSHFELLRRFRLQLLVLLLLLLYIFTRNAYERLCCVSGHFYSWFSIHLRAYCFHSSAWYFPFWNFLREMVHFPSHSLATHES